MRSFLRATSGDVQIAQHQCVSSLDRNINLEMLGVLLIDAGTFRKSFLANNIFLIIFS